MILTQEESCLFTKMQLTTSSTSRRLRLLNLNRHLNFRLFLLLSSSSAQLPRFSKAVRLTRLHVDQQVQATRRLLIRTDSRCCGWASPFSQRALVSHVPRPPLPFFVNFCVCSREFLPDRVTISSSRVCSYDVGSRRSLETRLVVRCSVRTTAERP